MVEADEGALGDLLLAPEVCLGGISMLQRFFSDGEEEGRNEGRREKETGQKREKCTSGGVGDGLRVDSVLLLGPSRSREEKCSRNGDFVW